MAFLTECRPSQPYESSFIMTSYLTRLLLVVVLCSVAAGCHRTSFGKSIGYPAPPPKSDLWTDQAPE
jgi:hypothetical protein